MLMNLQLILLLSMVSPLAFLNTLSMNSPSVILTTEACAGSSAFSRVTKFSLSFV